MPQSIFFSKYHGLGNDFLLLDCRENKIRVSPEHVRRLCHRTRGVGADGVLSISEPTVDEADLLMQVHNSDGSLAETCGNGLRCFAWHAVRGISELANRQSLRIQTAAGIREATVLSKDGDLAVVRVDMGSPGLTAEDVPTSDPLPRAGPVVEQRIRFSGLTVSLTAVSFGNPHAVIFDPDKDHELRFLGPALERHKAFPRGANVGLAYLDQSGSILLEVWERGVGPTSACGSGACAAAVAAVLTGRKRAGERIDVRLPGGNLCVEVDTELSRVFLTGPAEHVFDGEFVAESFFEGRQTPVEMEHRATGAARGNGLE